MDEKRRKEIVRILSEKILESESNSILAAPVPDMISVKGEYKAGQFTAWFREYFPEFELEEGVIRIAELPVRESSTSSLQMPIVNHEVQQMHAIAYMNWWTKNYQKLSAFGVHTDLNANELRDYIAGRMAIAILTGGAGFIDAIKEEPSRFAFDTGLVTAQDKPLYCVIGKNPVQIPDRQYWSFLDYCYPGEVSKNGLGIWLAKRVQNTEILRAYSDLALKIQESEMLRDKLADYSWEDEILSGAVPSHDFQSAIEKYFQGWTELQEIVAQLPAAPLEEPITLSSLANYVHTQTMTSHLLEQAAEKFHNVIDAIRCLFEKKRLRSGEGSTLAADQKSVEHILNHSNDASAADQLLELIDFYQDLLRVMEADYSSDVDEEIGRVPRHFREITLQLVFAFVRAPEEDRAFQKDLDEAKSLMSQYKTEQLRKGTGGCEPKAIITVEELLELALSPRDSWKAQWVSNAVSLLSPKTKAFLAESLSRDSSSPDEPYRELTPYGAGRKLFGVKGNHNQEAEKCFLLGLLYDPQRCAPALLRIYREENRPEEFLKIWDAYVNQKSGVSLPVEEQLYLVSTVADHDTDSVDWGCLENIIQENRSTTNQGGLLAALRPLAERTSDRPKAFWAWAGLFPQEANELEDAIADDDMDRVSVLLDDAKRLREMGFSDEEIAVIHGRIRENSAHGLDNYSIARRLIAVLGKGNNAAEKYLWASSANTNAQWALFDLYVAREDYASACWIISHFGLNTPDTRAEKYIHALVKCGNAVALEAFVAQRPELWYQEGVLSLLSIEREGSAARWQELLAWHLAHPIETPCPFELAVEEGEQGDVTAYLNDVDQMVAWGYSARKLEEMRAVSTQWAGVGGKEDFTQAAKRISEYQGNLHRFLEQFLYRSLKQGQSAARKLLFSLMVQEKRYLEAAAYFRSDPALFSGDAYKAQYIRALVALKDYQEISKEAFQNPRLFQKDPNMAREVFLFARDCGHPELERQITQIVNRMAWNYFEENIINFNLPTLQQMVSDPAQLLELGYTQQDVGWFKECLTKPIIKGSDGYSVAARMRLFFGDLRAEPFFANISSDPRAIKALLSIYWKNEKWDQLCNLYREHQSDVTWNREEQKQYLFSLSKAIEPENCKEFLHFVQTNPNIDPANTEIRWLCLRALAGANLWEEVEHQEEELLSDINERFRLKHAVPYLDALWQIGTDAARERAVVLVGKIYDNVRRLLSREELLQLISVNHHLTSETDTERWTAFLIRNGLERMSDLLSICFSFGLRNSREDLTRFFTRQVESLKDTTADLTIQELLLYGHLLGWTDVDETLLVAAADSLLNQWKPILSSRNSADWEVFLTAPEFGAFLCRNAETVVRIWSDTMELTDDSQERTALELIGMRLHLAIRDGNFRMDDQVFSAFEEQLVDTLLEVIERHEYNIDEEKSESITKFFLSVKLNAEQRKQFASVWMGLLDKAETEGMLLYEKVIVTMEEADPNWEYAELCADHLTAWLSSAVRRLDQRNLHLFSSCIRKLPLNIERAKRLTDSFSDERTNVEPELVAVLKERIQDRWPELNYQLIKAHCLSVENDSEEYQDALKNLVYAAEGIRGQIPGTSADQKLLYDAARLFHQGKIRSLLRECLESAGKTELTDILTALSVIDENYSPEAELDSLRTWLIQTLNTKDVSWIAKLSEWWGPLVPLSADDVQIQEIISYVGNTEEEISITLRKSILRLLISSLRNPVYLKSFLWIDKSFPRPAKGVLQYFLALADEGSLDEVVMNCIEGGQYDIALELLIKKMGRPYVNSSQVGLKLGEIYTPENLRDCPVLRERAPEVFEGIRTMNGHDTQGVWKNLGRAVDISCMAEIEPLYFEVFKDSVRDYSGKSAALIANMTLRGAFDDAAACLEATASTGSEVMLDLVETVLKRCRETGVLSREDELMLRIIPRDGNHPDMEAYGKLTCYAFDQGWRTECAWAMVELCKYFGTDRALLSACQQLSPQILPELGLPRLYELSKKVQQGVSDTYAFKTAKSLAILKACIAEGSTGNNDDYSLTSAIRTADLTQRISQTTQLMNLHDYCADFLRESRDTELHREILVRAAVGWWRIDAAEMNLISSTLHEHEKLWKTLAEIYPQSFAAACERYLLLNRARSEIAEKEIKQLLDAVKEASVRDRWNRRFLYCSRVTEERIAAACEFLDRPLEIAGLFTATLETIMQNESDGQAMNELGLLLAVRPSLNLRAYQTNTDSLKEIVKSRHSRYSTIIRKAFGELVPVSSSEEQYLDPAYYLYERDSDYVSVAMSAKQRLQRVTDKESYLYRINKTYRSLGEIMSEQWDSKELGNLKLFEILNMANLLCASPAYGDLGKFMGMIQLKPKWRICVLSLQELIQGCPRDVLSVFDDTGFLKHDGCCSALVALIDGFFGATERKIEIQTTSPNIGVFKLVEENMSTGRAQDWGLVTSEELRCLPRKEKYPRKRLLFANNRNYVVSKRPFAEEMNELLKELRRDDEEQANIGNETKETPDETNFSPEEQAANKSIEYRQVSYVMEQANRWTGEIEDLSEQRDALVTRANTTRDNEERIECLGKLIALDWDKEGNLRTYLRCIELGFSLFERFCVRKDFTMVVQPEARKTLYEISVFLPAIYAKDRYCERLKRDVLMCLSSYDSLTDLVTDCRNSALTKLCEAITDKPVSESYLQMIKLVKEFGESLVQSVNSDQRLSVHRNYIEKAERLRSPITADPIKRFTDLLNQQIQAIQGNAVVITEVYNDRAAFVEDDVEATVTLFGQMTNIGNADAEDVHLRLLVNNTFSVEYMLDRLPGRSQIPFELTFEPPEDCDCEDTVSYSLMASYRLQDKTMPEQVGPKTGTLTLYDPYTETRHYRKYQVTTAVEGADYQERESVLGRLKMDYGPEIPFNSFPNLAIYGMRRTGKSSVLLRTLSFIRESHGDTVLCVWVSAEGVSGSVAKAAHFVLVNKMLGRLEDMYAQTLGLNGQDWAEFCERWMNYPVKPDEYGWLEEFYEELTNTWTKGHGLVIFVDEIEGIYCRTEKREPANVKMTQTIFINADEDEEAYSRSADDTHSESAESADLLAANDERSGRVKVDTPFWDVLSRIVQRPDASIRFVLCGSDSFTNTAAAGDNLTQFFQRIERFPVGRMTRSEIEKTMRIIEDGSDIHFTSDAINSLWSLTKGLPWHSRHVGNLIISKRLLPSKRTEIYPSDIRWAVEEVLSSNQLSSDNTFGLSALNSVERCVVNVLAKTLGNPSDTVSATALYELVVRQNPDCQPKQFELAIKKLVSDLQFLSRSSIREKAHYQFGCELYRLYLRNQKGLTHFIRC